MAPFQHLDAAAAMVLARQAAIRLVKDRLAREGQRVHSVPARDIQIAADALLRQRPELIEQAAERVAAHPEWLPKQRGRRPVSVSGNARSGTDNAGEKAQPQSELTSR
jgi:hypothetical protein